MDQSHRGALSGASEAIPSASTHCSVLLEKNGTAFCNGGMDNSDAASLTSSRDAGSRSLDGHATSSARNYNASHGDDGKQDDTSGRTPAWSELKTKAGKERKRLPLACIACRRKKIRCSGEKPACKHCVRSRIPCVYKITTRKAAPRTDYMTMLDKRLKRMEERVMRIIPNPDLNRMSSIGRASVKPQGPQLTKSLGAKKRAADDAFTQELHEWSHTRQENLQQHMAVLDPTESTLFKDGSESLPSMDIQEHLAETFFDYVYGQAYQVLHKPSFMRRLKTGTAPPVLTLAICAVSARFAQHPQLESTEPAFLRGEQWAKPARDIALKRYDEPNITILTVLIILGLHEFGTCQGGRSWMLGGMAMRMAHALQLHRELDHDPLGEKNEKLTDLSFTDKEIRRRTMWACFLMDRFSSSGTERPMMLSDDSIEVQLPINEVNFQMEISGPTESLNGNIPNPVPTKVGQISDPKQNMGVAAYTVRVIAIWGRVINYLNLGEKDSDQFSLWDARSNFYALKKQLEEFTVRLPDRLKLSIENLQNCAAEKLSNQFIFLHICICQVSLFLHRFALPSIPGGDVTPDMPQEFVLQSRKIAVEAAGKISDLLHDATSHLVTAPFTGYCAFVSSTVHVWGIFSKNPQLELLSKRNLARNVKYISAMKQHWGIFYHMAEILRTIYRRHADLAHRGSNTNVDSVADTKSGTFEYGNWFNAYPHGVSRTDFQEPATYESVDSGRDAALFQKSDLQTVEEFFQTRNPQIPATQRKARKQNHSLSAISNSRNGVPGLKIESPTNSPMRNSQGPSYHDPDSEPKNLHTQHGPPSNALDSTDYNAHAFFSPQQQQNFNTPQQGLTSVQATGSPFDPSFFGTARPVSIHEMDRQFVFDAYAADPRGVWDFGMDDADSDLVGAPLPEIGNGVDPVGDVGGVPQDLQGPYADASSAWFMPFNLVPPDVGGGGQEFQQG